ncbi:MAG: HlyD family efflux transporter periplasmic adaptor subunit [Acidobacteriia bacterium]|nr:HlyD family efflux transporter periplasmic adaptor subunit [Terriglobia bacterium]
MKRKILTILLLAVAGTAAWLYWSGRFGRNHENEVLLSGNIELTEIDISFKVPGKLVELNVDEGTFVKKGTVIARIDRQQVEQQRSKDEASLAASQAQFDQIETGVRWQRETMESDIALRRAEVRAAQAHLDQLLAGSRPQEIQQARATVADATAQCDQAKADWDRAQELFKNDDISRAQYDQNRTRLDSTAAVLRQAQERLALVEEGPRKEDIEAARADLQRAEAALEASQANRLEVKRREQDVQAHRADIDRARAQVAISETQIGDTVVTSPIDGVVLVKAAEIGEVLAAGTTVVSIGDVEHPWLRAYISETDLGRVKLGQPVKLTSDSFPGKNYPGRVSFISSEAEFTPKQIQTHEERVKLVYRIKIDVDNPKHELKSNMPVDAEIQLN